MPAHTWPKYCTNCGRPIRRGSWNNLELKGTMKGSPRDPHAQKMELRNCACGSTLAVPESAAKKSEPPSG